ncbi:hypothetical protein WJX84_010591 [Apatococcus fuscideae]|uniref:Kinesin-like protein n=1 Tax=Apatococcus fuscideae TaxID=2026836 RepID=A0AAW1TET8_9CHLO
MATQAAQASTIAVATGHLKAIEGHLAQQVATALANLDHLKEHKHLILKSQGGSHLHAAGTPLTAIHNKENQEGTDGPEDLPSKLAALEKALVDRDLLLLRQNEDIASLEDQLARAQLNPARRDSANQRTATERDLIPAVNVPANLDAPMPATMELARDQIVLLRKALQNSQDDTRQAENSRIESEAALQSAVKELQSELTEQQQMWWRLEADCRNLQNLLAQANHEKRMLINQLLDLKGSIRVICRVRPMMSSDALTAATSSSSILEIPSPDTVILAPDRTERIVYDFDRVIGPSEGQEEVFNEAKGLVDSVAEGYNVCMLFFGPTGSGKTYTMAGRPGDLGMAANALAHLFRLAREVDSKQQVRVSASILEIHNEQINDLLLAQNQQQPKLEIKEGSAGVEVPGLTIKPMAGMQEAEAIMQRGRAARGRGGPEEATRSHLVLTIYVTCTHRSTEATSSGKLHLVDLAGSERLAKGAVTSERTKEVQAVHKSLTVLGDVIQAIQQKSSHVPFRNSKLTRLLEDSIGFNSRTMVVLTCSPASEDASETRSTLEFGLKARKPEGLTRQGSTSPKRHFLKALRSTNE